MFEEYINLNEENEEDDDVMNADELEKISQDPEFVKLEN